MSPAVQYSLNLALALLLHTGAARTVLERAWEACWLNLSGLSAKLFLALPTGLFLFLYEAGEGAGGPPCREC